MAIDSNLKIHPVSWLVGLREAGKINTDISIQRREVWDHVYKSNLIVAMLNNAPIANLCFEKDGKNSFKVIDGKQRTLTLCSFVADGFPLSPKMRYREVDDVDVAGLKFSELPVELQNKLLEYQLSFSLLNPLSEDERDFVFFMGNQSAPLTKIDLLPVVLGETIMEEFNKLCAHPFLIERVKLTAPARRKRDDLKILVQYLILQSKRDMGFSGKEIISFCDDIRNGEIEIPYQKVTELLNYIYEAITEKRAYLKLIHLPVMLYVAQQAMENAVLAESLLEAFDNFFMEIIDGKNEEYSFACQQGSAKKANVQLRQKNMSKILDDIIN